jgi:hypothetical protein
LIADNFTKNFDENKEIYWFLIVKFFGRLGKPLYLMYLITSWINLKFPFKLWFEIETYFLFVIFNCLFIFFVLLEIIAEFLKISLNIYQIIECYEENSLN